MGKLNYGATGVSYEIKKPGVIQSGAPRCPRCNDRVYFNEEKKAQGKSYHKRCFTCCVCKKSLDSTNYNDHDGDLYCTACHRKQFAPKGYGFAGGAAGLSANGAVPTPASAAVDSPNLSSSADALFKTQNGYHNGTTVNGTATNGVVDRNDPERCPRCAKRVYFAEEVRAQKRKWHKLCFKCQSCNKLLEPSRCNVHDNDLYCQACYGRLFGPKGYGFSGGCGSLLASDTHPEYLNHSTSSQHTYTERVADPRTFQAHTSVPRGPPASSEWTEPIDI